jgi:hypothetical protein
MANNGVALRARASRVPPRAPTGLGHSATIANADYTGRRGDLLVKAIQLLSMECDRREQRGEDVSHIRAFCRNAVNEAWS